MDLDRAQPAFFATTHWSVVLAAVGSPTPEASGAWEQLALTYWRPLYSHARRRGRSHAEAQDLAQGFFQYLIEKSVVGRAQRERGRFRTFLLAAFEHFLSDTFDRAKALKRGGGAAPISIPAFPGEEAEFFFEPAAPDSPVERQFDRDWAHSVLRRALENLAAEFVAEGKQETWHVLRPFLLRAPQPSEYEAAAACLNISSVLLRKAVSRLRQRVRLLVRQEIAHTVSTLSEVDEELRYLVDLIAMS